MGKDPTLLDRLKFWGFCALQAIMLFANSCFGAAFLLDATVPLEGRPDSVAVDLLCSFFLYTSAYLQWRFGRVVFHSLRKAAYGEPRNWATYQLEDRTYVWGYIGMVVFGFMIWFIPF